MKTFTIYTWNRSKEITAANLEEALKIAVEWAREFNDASEVTASEHGTETWASWPL